MDLEKKQLTKADGRYLVMYHFPATATADQTKAFKAAEKYFAAAERDAARSEPNVAPAADVKDGRA